MNTIRDYTRRSRIDLIIEVFDLVRLMRVRYPLAEEVSVESPRQLGLRIMRLRGRWPR